MLAVVSPWLPAPGEPLSVGLTLVPLDEGKLEADGGVAEEEDAAGLEPPGAGADVLTPGLAVSADLGLPVAQGGAVAWRALLLPVALVLAVVAAAAAAVVVVVVLAVLVALVLAVAAEVAVPVPVAVPVAEALPLSLGLTLVPWLPLALPLAVAVPEPVGGTLGSALLDLADLDALAGEVGDAQALARALLWLAAELEGAVPPFAEPAAVPEPARLGGPLLGLEEEIPTADPSETKASRSGGSERTTPMANTAQAAARTGLSSPSRQSRGRCRPRPLSPESSPPRQASQRPARPARKPPRAAARLLAWAGPDRTRARIRSSPSGPGST